MTMTLADMRLALELVKQEKNRVPEIPLPGYCEHGVYVGGCGADYMCGACEMEEDTFNVYAWAIRRVRAVRKFNRENAKRRVLDKWCKMIKSDSEGYSRRVDMFHRMFKEAA